MVELAEIAAESSTPHQTQKVAYEPLSPRALTGTHATSALVAQISVVVGPLTGASMPPVPTSMPPTSNSMPFGMNSSNNIAMGHMMSNFRTAHGGNFPPDIGGNNMAGMPTAASSHRGILSGMNPNYGGYFPQSFGMVRQSNGFHLGTLGSGAKGKVIFSSGTSGPKPLALQKQSCVPVSKRDLTPLDVQLGGRFDILIPKAGETIEGVRALVYEKVKKEDPQVELTWIRLYDNNKGELGQGDYSSSYIPQNGKKILWTIKKTNSFKKPFGMAMSGRFSEPSRKGKVSGRKRKRGHKKKSKSHRKKASHGKSHGKKPKPTNIFGKCRICMDKAANVACMVCHVHMACSPCFDTHKSKAVARHAAKPMDDDGFIRPIEEAQIKCLNCNGLFTSEKFVAMRGILTEDSEIDNDSLDDDDEDGAEDSTEDEGSTSDSDSD
jgi:hypothetical protein